MTQPTPVSAPDNWDNVAPNPNAVPNRFVFPMAQWQHGREALEEVGGVAFTGGMLIPAKHLPEDTALTGWQVKNQKFSRKKEAVYTHATPRLAVLRVRFRWVMKNGNGKSPMAEYADGAASQVHALVAIEGYEAGPVQLCLVGKSKTAPFSAARKAFMEAVIHPANLARAAKQRTAGQPATTLAPYAFWMPLAPGAHELIGEGAESSTVTPMGLALPELSGERLFKALYVGADNLRRFEQWYLETDGWELTWSKGQTPPPPDDTRDDAPDLAPEMEEEIPF